LDHPRRGDRRHESIPAALHRNAIGALIPAAVPVAASSSSAAGDWRAPVAASNGPAENLRADAAPHMGRTS
jgi:hypothetical protein